MKKSRFGKAFVNELNKVSIQTKHFKHKDTDASLWQDYVLSGDEDTISTNNLSGFRRVFLLIPILVIIFGLFLRLFDLQIVSGKDNRDLADSNRIQVKVIHAPRGVIYDRNGKVLAQNEPSFRLVESSGSSSVVTYLTRDEALKMEVAGDPKLKNLEIDNSRSYLEGEKLAHVLGYVGEITSDEMKKSEFSSYKLGDKIGRGGIEEVYEKVLRGVDGGEIIEVDASGKKLRTLRETPAISGQNIYLSIDASLQRVLYQKLEEQIKTTKSCCGAAIAQDPRTGEVLALVSYPSYDPQAISDALVAPNYPLLNRVIAGVYSPGSTFKIASSLAGLESGKITAETKFEDTGIMALGTYTFANWYFTQYGRKEGEVDIVKALKRSNDIFFYRLGQLIGEKAIGDTAKSLGLGKKLGIDLPGEVAGLIPDNSWKEKNIGESWYPGDTILMSIGQGYVLSTPLQVNNMTSAIASDGKQFPPHLVKKITDSQGKTIREFKYDGFTTKQFKKADIDLVKKGLEEVPSNGGTAWPFFTFPFKTAGKTGTVEFGDPQDKTHAWYTAYAPLEDPAISVTVLIEAGGEGSSDASPVVKETLRWFLSPDKSNLVKDSGFVATESARTLGE